MCLLTKVKNLTRRNDFMLVWIKCFPQWVTYTTCYRIWKDVRIVSKIPAPGCTQSYSLCFWVLMGPVNVIDITSIITFHQMATMRGFYRYNRFILAWLGINEETSSKTWLNQRGNKTDEEENLDFDAGFWYLTQGRKQKASAVPVSAALPSRVKVCSWLGHC